jgi:hypothetical protein
MYLMVFELQRLVLNILTKLGLNNVDKSQLGYYLIQIFEG